MLGLVDRKRMRSEVAAHLADLDINIPKLWGTPVESLSGGHVRVSQSRGRSYGPRSW
jgi:hypothetical protein